MASASSLDSEAGLDAIEVTAEVHSYEEKNMENRLEYSMEEDQQLKPVKRDREEDEIEWTKVEKKARTRSQCKIEMFISSRINKLPKQFAMAKLFEDLGFVDITKVKYLNPYKLKLVVPNEDYARKLIQCEDFQKKEWKVQQALEVSISYGIIRNVDLELTEDEALSVITCPDNIPILALKRLKRRDTDGNWIPSEVARVDFSSSYLPAFIYVNSLRTNVEPFVFRATQCSKCWRFGHTKIKCTSRNVVCPKCSGHHENCDTNIFKCANCHESHMALNRTCSVYLREKKLRELMARFNCTYRCACNLYVPMDSPPQKNTIVNSETDTHNNFSSLPIQSTYNREYSSMSPSFANVLKRPKSPQKKNKKSTSVENSNSDNYSRSEREQSEAPAQPPPSLSDERIPQRPSNKADYKRGDTEDKVCFSELITRLRDIIFIKNIGIREKISYAVKSCIDWLILLIVDNMTDWPILNNILEIICKFVNDY